MTRRRTVSVNEAFPLPSLFPFVSWTRNVVAGQKQERSARFEAWELTGDPWEPEAITLYGRAGIEHKGKEIREILEFAKSIAAQPPAAIEIGSHRGAFLVGVARNHAPNAVIGMEIRGRYHRLAGETMQKNGVENAVLFKGDGKLATIIAIPPESLDAVYVNFPDPWWKKRHASRRVLDVAFLRVLARRLKPRGRLYLKSDVFEYLHAVRKFAEASEAFRPLAPERWPDERAWTWTEREAKCMRGAVPFGRGYYERKRDFDSSLPLAPEDLPELDWEEMIVGRADIKGRPPVDKEARRRTAEAARRRAEEDAYDRDASEETDDI